MNSEKLYEEKGKWTMNYISEMKPQGALMKQTFMSEFKGSDKFPSGKNMGSGETWINPEGKSKGKWRGMLMTSDGEMIVWNALGKGKGTPNGYKGVWTITYMTKSEKYSWLNSLIDVADVQGDMESLSVVGYEWK